MRVIVNSDVLFGGYLRPGLPKALQSFAEACEERSHVLVIPLTALYEVERSQSDQAQAAAQEVSKAFGILDRFGIAHGADDPETVVPVPDLISLFRESAPSVEIAEPTLDDFSDAHRRACLHEAPHPPDMKSDEMRDLVIWATACRIAREDGHALLVSRDVVHTHERGNAEADASNLVRLKSVEDALGYLEVKTPAGALLERMMASSWDRLRESGLPLAAGAGLLGVTKIRFVQGVSGPEAATGTVVLQGDGGVAVNADARIDLGSFGEGTLKLSNVRVGESLRENVVVPARFVEHADRGESFRSRMELLRRVVEGDDR